MAVRNRTARPRRMKNEVVVYTQADIVLPEEFPRS